MNIGIIHGFVGGGGGTEKTLLAIIEALAETDHNVTLYTFSKPNLSTKKITIKSSIPLSIPAFGLFQRAMESKLILKTKKEDIIIQASGGLSLPDNSEQKVIVYCHNDFSSETEKSSTKYKGIWALYYKAYYKLIMKSFEKINKANIHLISNSKFIQQSIHEKFGKDSVVISPPIDITEFQKKLRKKNQVVTIARFSKEKNLEFALDVIAEIETNYCVIGNTKTKSNIIYYNELLEKVKNMDSKIELFKDLPRSDVIKNLLEAKVYFHASPETFGISIVESIAAGCIPIVPDNSAHRETVPFSELRYNPDDIEDAKSKVRKALSGEYDQFVSSLQNNLPQFGIENFKKLFFEYLNKP